jgi:conjugal transfer/entry exclusion protein
MQTSRRSLIVAALLAGPAVAIYENDAHADLFGGDLPLLGGILTQALATVSNLASMYETLKSQLATLERTLSHLSLSSFSDVMQTIRSTQFTYNMIAGDVRSIGYTINAVNQRYRQLFPNDVTTQKPAEMRATAAGWHQETLDAAIVAQRSQSSLSTIQNNTDRATAILSTSSGADGIVAQLQAVNQMLGVISSQMNSMISVLDTTGRVTADMAATNASQNVISIEKKNRNLDNYTDRGPQTPVMTKLPDPY